jgi:hypothetical protein
MSIQNIMSFPIPKIRNVKFLRILRWKKFLVFYGTLSKMTLFSYNPPPHVILGRMNPAHTLFVWDTF